MRHLCAVFAVLCAVGCTANDSTARSTGADGAMIAGSAIPTGADSIVAERVLQIGALDGPSEYVFGRIVAIAPTADSGFYTCDGEENVIRQFAADGSFVRQVGRPGAGPGESRSCASLAIDVDASLVVSDRSNERISRFAPDGAAQPSLSIVTAGGLGGPDSFLIDSAGRYWRKACVPSEGGRRD